MKSNFFARSARSVVTVGAITAGLIGIGLPGVMGVQAASAAATYRTTASPTLNARSGPGTSYGVVASIPSVLDIFRLLASSSRYFFSVNGPFACA